ncbi:hypothetical protein ZYGR_0I03700 [Zygosaccharomyces rouxii]|uniref:ZYRO0C08866p n=2 Tax=Zygosaccharomyces rouxii TaxID=4956 RepID=C5DTI6_ZYGRC|nr:uncharacterized protein ZYRO0C08866g [Zygosaccharomyces rouxii]KAH9201724.1 hypothetical protein LQ764DRAFT_208468 [Zygosaccharomyces rouxii]GAV48073.1 hypothetical protein ZYGR_0I03700 [Zygosaccharomyces rouxii]CAR27097.1 ZYRO0C08866p [Zygosaccharomyces rouxii]
MGSKEGLLDIPQVAESSASLSSRDVASAISLYEPSTNQENLDNLSMKAVYEMDSEGDSISRPLSRGSVTSGVSMMATKDGVEGERITRLGIPQYSLNLLNSMAHNQYKKMHGPSLPKGGISGSTTGGSNNGSIISNRAPLPQTAADSPNSPPMTLREKMKLLGNERQVPLMDTTSNDAMDGTLLYDTAPERHGNIPNYSLHAPEGGIIHGHMMSEIDSNSSTVGDDTSFQNLNNLSPAVGTMYSDND